MKVEAGDSFLVMSWAKFQKAVVFFFFQEGGREGNLHTTSPRSSGPTAYKLESPALLLSLTTAAKPSNQADQDHGCTPCLFPVLGSVLFSRLFCKL